MADHDDESVLANPGDSPSAFRVAVDKIADIIYPIFKMAFGANGSRTLVDADNPLPVAETTRAIVDDNNSSAIPLGISEVFTGESTEMLPYAAAQVLIFADKSSATDGLSLQWSSNGADWDLTEEYDVIGGAGFFVQAMKEGQYFRAIYTNGGVAQTAFRMQVILSSVPSVGEVQPVDVNITAGTDAQLVRAVLTGKKPDDDYTNVNVTTSGNLKSSLEEFDEAFQTNPLPVIDKVLSEAFDEKEYLSTYLLDTAAIDMAVDGTTPVTYKYTVPADTIFYLKRGLLVIEDGAVAFLPGNFGALGSALTNGVSIGITPSGESRVEMENWKTNRQIRDTMFDFDQQFRTDGSYVGRWSFTKDTNIAGLVLSAGDIFDFTIQDNLSGLDYLSFKLKGILKPVV